MKIMEITESKLKKILREQREEYQRYFDVLKEDFDNKVNLILAQNNSIIERLDNHEKILNLHTQILNSHTADIEIIKVDIQFIKNSLKKKVDVEEFEALERRVAILEAKTKLFKGRK
jgi:viroplasmin and RNaseH domain-containing protein